MVERICQWSGCRQAFEARPADVRRGWARFCSKSCKANHQEARTGQYRNLRRDNAIGDPRAYDGINFIGCETDIRPDVKDGDAISSGHSDD